MFGAVKRWYGQLMSSQEEKLRVDLEATKRLPKTPERESLIIETERLLTSGSAEPTDRQTGVKIQATKIELVGMRTEHAIDNARRRR
jgi:hypothetical protein